MFISEKYFLKPGNQTCASKTKIDNMDECKLASGQKNLAFGYSITKGDYPKGCFLVKDTPYVFWNTHISGSPAAEAHPICKSGEWFKLIPTNLLYA